MFTIYILYSKSIDRYYVGYTSQSVSSRLSRHLSNHKGFTSRAKDWELCHTELCPEKRIALLKEKQIKKRGARRYLSDLI